jgi:hypothetical protein
MNWYYTSMNRYISVLAYLFIVRQMTIYEQAHAYPWTVICVSIKPVQMPVLILVRVLV